MAAAVQLVPPLVQPTMPSWSTHSRSSSVVPVIPLAPFSNTINAANNGSPFPNALSPPQIQAPPSRAHSRSSSTALFGNATGAPPLASFPVNTSAVPDRNEHELTRDQLYPILVHMSTLIPGIFPASVLPLRLIVHGGACMLLHQGLWSLSQALPEGLKRRTTTRDVDYIERCFKEEMKRRGVVDAVERLVRCRDETARVFGLGKDWMNADADVALPMAVDPTGQTYDPIYTAAIQPNNTSLHTIFTSPNGMLQLVSVTPFWAVALKLVRYTKWDPGDICLLLRNGTILSQVQWTPEMLENWLHKNCWAMGYAQYPQVKKDEMRQRIMHAMGLLKEVWDSPQDDRGKHRERGVDPEGAMGGGEVVGGPTQGWMWSLAGVQGSAAPPPPGGGSAPAVLMPSNTTSPPFVGSPPNHALSGGAAPGQFTNFQHVSEWAEKKGRSQSKSASSGGSKSRSRGQSRSRRTSPQSQPHDIFGNPNREREREEERNEIFVPPLLDDFSSQQPQQWYSMNPTHGPISRSRPRSGSHTPEVEDLYAGMGNMNLSHGSNIYAAPTSRAERKSRNPNPWQSSQKDSVEALDRGSEGMLYGASYVHTVGEYDDMRYMKQKEQMKDRKRKEKKMDKSLARARDEKWTVTRLSRDSSITVYTDSSFDSSSEESEGDTETDIDSDEERLVGRGRSSGTASRAGMTGSGSSSQWPIYSPPTHVQAERSMSSMGQHYLPVPVARESSGTGTAGRKSKSPSPHPKHRPPPLPLTPMPVYAPQGPSQQQQQQQRPMSRSHSRSRSRAQSQQGASGPAAQWHPAQSQQMPYYSQEQQQQQLQHQPFAQLYQQQQQLHQLLQQPQAQAPGMGIYMTPHVSQSTTLQHAHNQMGMYQQHHGQQQQQQSNTLGLF